MIRKLLKFDNIKFRQCSLSYALWSDGIIEKVVIKNSRVVFFKEIKVTDNAVEFNSCEKIIDMVAIEL